MEQIPRHELKRLEELTPAHEDDPVARRAAGEPLQYIEGTAAFGPLELQVDERVLIPRPETEGLFELATRMVRNPKVVVDLCTGSGALALALKTVFPSAAVFATDISPEAIAVAEVNRRRLGLDLYLAVGHLYEALPPSILGEVDLLVANPPYVAEGEYDHLPEEVKREPRIALVAGETGLELIEAIGSEAHRWLRPGGVAMIEIGETQGAAAAGALIGLSAVVRRDLAGRDRYLVGVKP